MEKVILNPELKGRYKVVNTKFPCVRTANRLYDFRTLTEEEAEELIASGCGYLEKIKK